MFYFFLLVSVFLIFVVTPAYGLCEGGPTCNISQNECPGASFETNFSCEITGEIDGDMFIHQRALVGATSPITITSGGTLHVAGGLVIEDGSIIIEQGGELLVSGQVDCY